MSSNPSPKRPVRQQPGLACEECRRRKARCDRAQPQCGACMMTGRVCIVNYDRPRRGPKKGQLKALYSRLEVLEEQLVVQLDNLSPSEGPQETQPDRPESSRDHNAIVDEEEEAHHEVFSSPSPEGETLLSPPTMPARIPSTSTSRASDTLPSSFSFSNPDIVRADLDQLYFDRVHPIAPFLHQRRYFSYAERESQSMARACLRSAMRTFAAALSAQFRGLAESLYGETRQILQTLDTMERSPPLELIQALLLLAHYELLQMQESRAMVTAGRCFRLIQLSRLHDTDAHDNERFTPAPGFNEAFAVAEEKRRTFWVAYCFDRFLSSQHEWPLTLQEDAIRTRLPLPETSFQDCRPRQMEFLHEAIPSSGHRPLHPFAECIVFATLYGRCMNLGRMATLVTPPETQEFWTRHKTLSDIVEKRTQSLARNLPTPSSLVDPLLAFTHMLARSTVVYLGQVTETNQWGSEEERLLSVAYMRRAFQGAREMVRLAVSTRPFNCFKAHPFLPNAISRAAGFLSTHTKVMEQGGSQRPREVEELFRVLRDLKVVNGLARELLRELEGPHSYQDHIS